MHACSIWYRPSVNAPPGTPTYAHMRPLCRNLDLLLGLENRILYTAIDILDGECRLDQALIRDKRWKNLSLLSMSRNRQR